MSGLQVVSFTSSRELLPTADNGLRHFYLDIAKILLCSIHRLANNIPTFMETQPGLSISSCMVSLKVTDVACKEGDGSSSWQVTFQCIKSSLAKSFHNYLEHAVLKTSKSCRRTFLPLQTM
jgi:hypothetical protein